MLLAGWLGVVAGWPYDLSCSWALGVWTYWQCPYWGHCPKTSDICLIYGMLGSFQSVLTLLQLEL